ncbi:MAG TPA: hypothetical protein VMR33_05700 [Candidatus Baltobacteraceae bacterium]|jgi:hypothetical protein|nr:hypothetical protein [Candidatus Baltobacteraceae bacterium]
MKKLVAILLLAAVSWALAGTPAQAAEVNSSAMTLAHKHHHHKKQKHHTKARKHVTA